MNVDEFSKNGRCRFGYVFRPMSLMAMEANTGQGWRDRENRRADSAATSTARHENGSWHVNILHHVILTLPFPDHIINFSAVFAQVVLARNVLQIPMFSVQCSTPGSDAQEPINYSSTDDCKRVSSHFACTEPSLSYALRFYLASFQLFCTLFLCTCAGVL